MSESTRQKFVLCLESAKNDTFEEFPAEYANPGDPETLPMRLAIVMLYIHADIKKMADCEESIQLRELFNIQAHEFEELLEVMDEMPKSALVHFLANHNPEINPDVYLDIQDAMNRTLI